MAKKYLVLGAKENSYINRSGEEVSTFEIYYFDFSAPQKSQLEVGFAVVSRNVWGSFSILDFPFLPGYYELGFRQSLGRRGRGESRLVKVNPLKPFSLADLISTSSLGDTYCVIHASKVVGYKLPDSDRVLNGVSFTYFDPLVLGGDEGFHGYVPMKSFTEQVSPKVFTKAPGFFNLEFEEVRGKGGRAASRLSEAEFVVDLKLAAEVAAA